MAYKTKQRLVSLKGTIAKLRAEGIALSINADAKRLRAACEAGNAVNARIQVVVLQYHLRRLAGVIGGELPMVEELKQLELLHLE